MPAVPHRPGSTVVNKVVSVPALLELTSEKLEQPCRHVMLKRRAAVDLTDGEVMARLPFTLTEPHEDPGQGRATPQLRCSQVRTGSLL